MADDGRNRLARGVWRVGMAHQLLDEYDREARRDDGPAGCGTLGLGCLTIVIVLALVVLAVWLVGFVA